MNKQFYKFKTNASDVLRKILTGKASNLAKLPKKDNFKK
jgi:hypothetical protein